MLPSFYSVSFYLNCIYDVHLIPKIEIYLSRWLCFLSIDWIKFLSVDRLVWSQVNKRCEDCYSFLSYIMQIYVDAAVAILDYIWSWLGQARETWAKRRVPKTNNFMYYSWPCQCIMKYRQGNSRKWEMWDGDHLT